MVNISYALLGNKRYYNSLIELISQELMKL